jgi:hypothetical protein
MPTQTYTPENLLAGGTQLVSETATILDGQTLALGEIVGKVTATGKIKALNTAGTDGSETPYGILAEAAAASGADATSLVYLKGEFRINAVTSATSTPVEQKSNLRLLGIYLKDSVKA